MARKLTNTQMDILADRAADLIEAEYAERAKSITVTPEYINFDKEFTDDTVAKLRVLSNCVNDIEAQIQSLELQRNEIYEETKLFCVNNNLPYNKWYKVNPNDVLEKYLAAKKDEVFPNVTFNRDKVLRKLKADILISNLEDTSELVNSIVETFKK